MKKQNIFPLLYQLAAPVGLILVGAILALAPDVLTFLISRFLGWALLLGGLGFAAAAFFGSRKTVGKLFWALAAFAIGGWLLRHPLGLATQVGTFLGILLMIRGGRDLRLSNGSGKPVHIATMAVGLVLVLCPMAASRIVFSLCGVAIVILGIIMAVSKWKDQKYLGDGGKPDIIDAL